MNPFIMNLLVFGGSALFSSVKIVNEKNEYLVERFGSYNKKLSSGINIVVPLIDHVVYKETILEKVLDIPPNLVLLKSMLQALLMRWFIGELWIWRKLTIK